MKTNIPVFFLLATLLVFFPNCTTDYFGLSSELDEETYTDSSFSSEIPMAYCNKFNKNGFKGILTAYYDAEQDTFNKNKAILYLWNIPDEFTYPPTNYIQVHSFTISNNRTAFNPTPTSMTITKIKGSNREQSSIITTLGHDLLEYLGDISIAELTKNYSFILKDMDGWHGISISVFNARNKPEKTIKILIPPFPANPHTYLEKNNQERLLFELHPFETISYNNDMDQVFYEKGVDFCKDSPVEFEIPGFTKSSTTTDPVEQLIEDLSFLPDL